MAEEKGKIINLEMRRLLKEIDQYKQVIQDAEEALDAAIEYL